MSERHAVVMCPPACRMLFVSVYRDAVTGGVGFDQCPVVAIRSTTDGDDGTDHLDPVFEDGGFLTTLRAWRADYVGSPHRLLAAEWPPSEDEARLGWVRQDLERQLLEYERWRRAQDADERDALDAFVRERCELAPEHKVRAAVLHAAYQAWHRATGEKREPLSLRKFGEKMRGRFEKKTSNGDWYLGVRVAPPSAPAVPAE